MALHLGEKFYPHLLTIICGRTWLLTHSMELAVVKCLNSPEYLSALGTTIGKAIEKADYIIALQQLQNANFPLLAELKSNKDSSVEAIMEILHLENYVAEKLGVRKIKKNIANQRSILRDVFVPLAEPFSSAVLMGAEVTPDVVPATATTMTLSPTLASTSAVDPISIDDYKVVDADDQAVAGENVASFPNMDDAKLHIP
nr:hypothetical protein [Tanacetum cinerariifolium]